MGDIRSRWEAVTNPFDTLGEMVSHPFSTAKDFVVGSVKGTFGDGLKGALGGAAIGAIGGAIAGFMVGGPVGAVAGLAIGAVGGTAAGGLVGAAYGATTGGFTEVVNDIHTRQAEEGHGRGHERAMDEVLPPMATPGMIRSQMRGR